MAFSLFIFAFTICVQLRRKKRKTFLKADFMIRLFNHIVKPKSTKRENGQTAINNISESRNRSRSRSSFLNSLLPVSNSNLLFLSGKPFFRGEGGGGGSKTILEISGFIGLVRL